MRSFLKGDWFAARTCLFVGFLVTFPAMALAENEPDERTPRDKAQSMAMQVGTVEAMAEICAAPPATFREVVAEARRIFPEVFRQAGLDQDDLDSSIELGFMLEIQRHKSHPNNRKHPNCNAFRRIVSSLLGHVTEAKGRPRQPLVPYDTDGWQERVGREDQSGVGELKNAN
ncbi:hypothetical protein [Telmatospirillum siberiense]|uniref:TIGR02301 family protein n=1 Tax=Telmatospirillum siberiense TaxID=382514 RepID=A0A2N3PXK4_9PROT|nr:hypothetical protein [Telmatospirillum siberiense]PKU25119.1 hypothetical protein CWS72_07930 [Telmatospirillum siberiense]